MHIGLAVPVLDRHLPSEWMTLINRDELREETRGRKCGAHFARFVRFQIKSFHRNTFIEQNFKGRVNISHSSSCRCRFPVALSAFFRLSEVAFAFAFLLLDLQLDVARLKCYWLFSNQ